MPCHHRRNNPSQENKRRGAAKDTSVSNKDTRIDIKRGRKNMNI